MKEHGFYSISFPTTVGGEGQRRKLRKAESLEARARELLEEAEAQSGRGDADASWQVYVKHRDLFQSLRGQLVGLASGAALSRSAAAVQLLVGSLTQFPLLFPFRYGARDGALPPRGGVHVPVFFQQQGSWWGSRLGLYLFPNSMGLSFCDVHAQLLAGPC
jgi:hypothetical protein